MQPIIITPLLAFLLLTLSSPSLAARVWLFESVEIVDARMVNIGGSHALTVTLSDSSGSQAYSCVPTEESGVVSFWASSVTNTMSALLSVALSAQVTGSKVDLLVEDSSCNTGNAWSNGNGVAPGLGLELRGIKILGE